MDDYLAPWDGVYNSQAFQYYYQIPIVAPEGELVKISDMVVIDSELGYLYEGLLPLYPIQ